MPIGPAPMTTPRSPGAILRLRGGLEADGERLDHRGFGEGHRRGQLVGEGGRVDDIRRQAAVDRRRRPEGDARVDVVDAELGGARVRVGDARLHAHPVADLEAGDTRPDLDHGSRSLVAEHHRRVDHERADPAVGVVVHVAAADADGVHLDLDLARPGRDRQVDVAEGQFPLPLKHECAHVLLRNPRPPGPSSGTRYAAQSSRPGGGMAPVMIATASDIE